MGPLILPVLAISVQIGRNRGINKQMPRMHAHAASSLALALCRLTSCTSHCHPLLTTYVHKLSGGFAVMEQTLSVLPRPSGLIASYCQSICLPQQSCGYQGELSHKNTAGCPQEVGLQPALAEQQEVVQEFGAEISQEALNHMEALQRNITEALRINPPLTLLLRQVKKSFAVTTSSGKTHIIPKVLTLARALTLPCCHAVGCAGLPSSTSQSSCCSKQPCQ